MRVGMIDQNLPGLDHPEYAGKVVKYFDTGTMVAPTEGSMHGPAVLSLLVGQRSGTAPGSLVYYAAAPSWTGDAAYYAAALRWLMDENRRLSQTEKIKVVSVSAGPSGLGSNFTRNTSQWDEAVADATSAGLLVLDCTKTWGKIGACRYDPAAPELVRKCAVGCAGGGRAEHRLLLAPASCRSQAETYRAGIDGWQYTGRGGRSWAIPWAAGVLCLAWEVRPALEPGAALSLMKRAAHVTADGAAIIDPCAFVSAVEQDGS